MGNQEQEPRDSTKKGAATATSSSRSFRISLQEMSDARTENLRDGGQLYAFMEHFVIKNCVISLLKSSCCHFFFFFQKFLADYGLIWVGNTNCSKYPETIAK